MESKEIAQIAGEIAQLYPAVYRRFHTSRQPLPGLDITPRMLGVLQHLAASGPLTLSELVVHLKLSKAATTELVDRLEAKNLVARIRDERDHRRVFIWLSEVGQTSVTKYPQVLQDDLLVRAVAQMRPLDRIHLVEGLRALLEAEKEISNE